MHKKIISLLSLLFLTTIILSACSTKPQPAPAEPDDVIDQAEVLNSRQIEEQILPISITAEQDEINAFELLKSLHKVTAKTYDFGVFIEEIDGVKNTEKNYWALYVNGEYAQKGADQTILQKGDTIEFRYEEIQQ